ncbi:LssY C-terminal domain-containing protein [Aestuariivirga sp.]|uniref:LssY C-terminal domain-containing protein n=1 Tax=Aestuariivirga sp. TaxID=2650926 RepID=UPI0025C6E41C|nr:LssY C-terminal domain-containing protein [Aestuariivirga sp.]MCA3554444.1 LssY C-terminal domain-containing protein [Aestuariivirga sp.]
MRLLQRLWRHILVFLLGILTVWLIVDVIFRITDNRLPWIFALAVTYGLAAYVILPRAIRLAVKLLHRQHVPEYTTTGDGLPGDPVNLALIGTLPQLRAAFARIGWTEADALGLASSWRMARAFVFNKPYPSAPFSTLFLFGRGQDIGFQKAIDGSPRKRHHVRFWSISQSAVEKTLGTPGFWLHTGRTPDNERSLWVGAATQDTGFSLTWLTFQITHATAADTNAERDLIIAELRKMGQVSSVTAYNERNELPARRVNRYLFDGDVSVAMLNGEA